MTGGLSGPRPRSTTTNTRRPGLGLEEDPTYYLPMEHHCLGCPLSVNVLIIVLELVQVQNCDWFLSLRMVDLHFSVHEEEC